MRLQEAMQGVFHHMHGDPASGDNEALSSPAPVLTDRFPHFPGPAGTYEQTLANSPPELPAPVPRAGLDAPQQRLLIPQSTGRHEAPWGDCAATNRPPPHPN